jgi:hypothetical protein
MKERLRRIYEWLEEHLDNIVAITLISIMIAAIFLAAAYYEPVPKVQWVEESELRVFIDEERGVVCYYTLERFSSPSCVKVE